MRRFFILFLVLVGVALFITQFTVTDPGYIAIAYQDWLIETSVAAAGIASIIGLILILLFAQLIIFLLQMPVFMRHRRFISRAKKSQYQHMQWTENGLIALAKGNWAKAEKYLIDAAQNNPSALLNYLAAARAADARGDFEYRNRYLKQALNVAHHKEARFAVGLTQAQLQFNSDQSEECLATLIKLNVEYPKQPMVIKLLCKVHQKLKDWNALRELLPSIQSMKIFSENELNAIEKQIYQALLINLPEETIQQKKSFNDTESLSLKYLHQLWDEAPKFLKKDANFFTQYVSQLIAIGANLEARKLIEEGLHREWHDRWVLLYGQVQLEDQNLVWNHAQKWLQQKPNNAALRLTLGRIASRLKMWKEAQEHYQASLKFKPSTEAYFELARIMDQHGDTKTSLELHQKGVSLLYPTLTPTISKSALAS